MIRAIAALVFLSLFSGIAAASDGVLEISQVCAEQTGCFPGDVAGWPVTITSSTPARSFRLTSDLGPLAANDTAIEVETDNASIDLGGFRIYGTTSCTAVPVTCSPSGSGVGVAGGSDVTVRNGTIHGMGDDAVRLTWSSRAENLHTFHNGGDGVDLGNDGTVRGNQVTSNGGDGIRCITGCTVAGNNVVGNGGIGILAEAGGLVEGNSVRANQSVGIAGSQGTPVPALPLVTGNTVVGNAGGVFAGVCSNNVIFGSQPFVDCVDRGGNSCNGTAACP